VGSLEVDEVLIPPRTERGTKSVTSISPKVKIPPPPIPWIERPTSLGSQLEGCHSARMRQTHIMVKFVATAATMDPTAKNKEEHRTSYTRQ
jgi:hypothetical protein